MISISVNFHFLRGPEAVADMGDAPLTNDEVYRLRRTVAETLRRVGFGEIIEREDNCFDNEFATPRRDVNVGNGGVLILEYLFVYPGEHGDIPELLGQEFPFLLTQMHERFPGLQLRIETYSWTV